jgi:hypothetical protein
MSSIADSSWGMSDTSFAAEPGRCKPEDRAPIPGAVYRFTGPCRRHEVGMRIPVQACH